MVLLVSLKYGERLDRGVPRERKELTGFEERDGAREGVVGVEFVKVSLLQVGDWRWERGFEGVVEVSLPVAMLVEGGILLRRVAEELPSSDVCVDLVFAATFHCPRSRSVRCGWIDEGFIVFLRYFQVVQACLAQLLFQLLDPFFHVGFVVRRLAFCPMVPEQFDSAVRRVLITDGRRRQDCRDVLGVGAKPKGGAFDALRSDEIRGQEIVFHDDGASPRPAWRSSPCDCEPVRNVNR